MIFSEFLTSERFSDLFGLEERHRIADKGKRRYRLGTIRYFNDAVNNFFATN
jgi:hypothetical protein